MDYIEQTGVSANILTGIQNGCILFSFYFSVFSNFSKMNVKDSTVINDQSKVYLVSENQKIVAVKSSLNVFGKDHS